MVESYLWVTGGVGRLEWIAEYLPGIEQSDLKKKIQPNKIPKYQLQNCIQILKTGYITQLVVVTVWGGQQIDK